MGPLPALALAVCGLGLAGPVHRLVPDSRDSRTRRTYDVVLALGSGRLRPIVDDESSEESEDSAGCGAFLAVNGRSDRGTDESCRRECPDFLRRGALGA